MNDAHHIYHKELYDAKELDEAYKWFDLRDREHFHRRFRINEALHSVEKTNQGQNVAGLFKIIQTFFLFFSKIKKSKDSV